MKLGCIIWIFFITITVISCESRIVKYDGLNDLVVGVHQVVLYENGEFYLELGAGGTKGTYKIQHDTVYLNYLRKPDGWPDQLLMTQEYFITINQDNSQSPIKISR